MEEEEEEEEEEEGYSKIIKKYNILLHVLQDAFA
jgi:hypothetical protein